MNTKKSAVKKKRPMKAVERQPVAEMPIEPTTIDVIEGSASGVVAVTQYESGQATTSIAAGEADEGIAPAGTSTMATDQSERTEHEAEEQRDARTG
jgi:hypothetical protein